MTIEKHGNKWRITEMKDGVRYRASVDFKPSKRDAEEIIQKQVASASNSPQQTHGMTFKDAACEYMSIKNNILSPNTIRGYRNIIAVLPEWFCSRKIDKLTQLDVQKVINDLSADHSPKTIRNYHGLISAVLGTYRPNLSLKTSLPLKRKFDPYTPLDSDVQQILDEVSGTKYDIPFHLAVYGMRRGEICAITSADLSGNWLSIDKSLADDPDLGWVIKPIPKTSESIRKIYIDDETAAKIRKMDGPVYPGKPQMLLRKLHDIQKKLGLPQFRLHDFRAYYVTMAHKIGIPDKFIMKNCGFSSSIVMDRVYKRAQEDAMKDFNKLYAEKITPNLPQNQAQNL